MLFKMYVSDWAVTYGAYFRVLPSIPLQALANRLRAAARLPAHENLYATAGIIQKKLETRRAEAEAAKLKVSRFSIQ